MTATLEAKKELVLTKADPCDRCGTDAVKAVVRVVLENELVLDFCGHHFAAHEEPLREIASEVIDERHTID